MIYTAILIGITFLVLKSNNKFFLIFPVLFLVFSLRYLSFNIKKVVKNMGIIEVDLNKLTLNSIFGRGEFLWTEFNSFSYITIRNFYYIRLEFVDSKKSIKNLPFIEQILMQINILFGVKGLNINILDLQDDYQEFCNILKNNISYKNSDINI